MSEAKKNAAKKAAKKPEETPAETQPSDLELLQASESFEDRFKDEIARRMSLGLTREQAIDVQKQQVLNDAELAKAK